MSDVVVIGGGVIGVCAALELAQRGAKVTLLERGPRLGSGCSEGNAGLVCPSHAEPLATRAALVEGMRSLLDRDGPVALHVRPGLVPWLARFVAACTPAREHAATRVIHALSQASLLRHEELAREHATGVERHGTLNVYETESRFERGRRTAEGTTAQILVGDDATTFEPALRKPVAGGIYYPEELSGDPLTFVEAIGRAAEAAGAVIRTGVDVQALGARGRVVTSAGTIDAGTVVLAAGVWSPRLAAQLRVSIPVVSGKGYHLDYAGAEGDPRVPLFLQEARVVVTPLPGKLRLAGTLELGGHDLALNERRLDAVRRAGLRRVHGLDGRNVIHRWSGARPCAPDGLPLVGRPRAYDNLVVATGHAMMGFTLAPVTGALVADIVSGTQPSQDIALLDPDRFAWRHSIST
ncbi:MAG: D-amino-acid dehydrogenase [Gaiellaceae bacterium]|nr:D-amino-acid dehydrogenase [Gaiellaceae bacterium]